MKDSYVIDIFGHACFFLVLSALVIPVLRYFKVPIALGYLLAGIAVGPYGIGQLVEYFPLLHIINIGSSDHVKILAELGIILLLFVIGLEITPRRLWQMRSLVFGLGTTQVVITALAIGSIAYMWGNNVQVSMLLGLGLALSSTALVTQWLHEEKLFVTHVGRTSFSILLFQDLALIPILLLLTVLSADTSENITQFVSLSILKMIATVFAIYVGGKIILKPLFFFASRHGGAEVFMALSLLVIVVSGSIASMAGLSMALGAFIAGLLLADTQYRHEISSLIVPFKSMLLGIFFLSFGMGINVAFVLDKPLWIFISVFGLIGLKTLITFLVCKAWNNSTAVSAESAIQLSQAGEFGLLIVGSALAAGMMAEQVGQFMLIIVGMTMIFTPILVIIARKVGVYIEMKTVFGSNKDESIPEQNQHAVIFGYGRIGNEIGNLLSLEGISILGFEKDITRVNAARSETCPVYLGDANRKNTLEAAQLDKALCVIVTIDNPDQSTAIVKSVREIHPNVPILVRAHNNKEMEELLDIDGVNAVAEHLLISHDLANKALKYFGYNKATA